MSEYSNQMKPVWEIPNPKLSPPYNRHWTQEDRRRFMLLYDISLQRILEILDSSYDKIFSSEELMNPRLNKKKLKA